MTFLSCIAGVSPAFSLHCFRALCALSRPIKFHPHRFALFARDPQPAPFLVFRGSTLRPHGNYSAQKSFCLIPVRTALCSLWLCVRSTP